jgi:hypothetical protein
MSYGELTLHTFRQAHTVATEIVCAGLSCGKRSGPAETGAANVSFSAAPRSPCGRRRSVFSAVTADWTGRVADLATRHAIAEAVASIVEHRR